jgi:hypothetical protein
MSSYIAWDSLNGILADGDLINVTIEPMAAAPDAVDFRLVAGPDITWWKGLLVSNGLGSSWQIYTHDGRTEDSVALWAHEVHNGQFLEFRKAKFLGFHTGMYLLGDLGRLSPGTRVTFQWVQDDAAPLQAGIFASASGLNLPFHDGRYWTHVGETFSASVRVWNMTDSYPWVPERRYRLGSWNPPDNVTWGLSRVELPGRVPALGLVDFNFATRAPTQPGAYPFSWRMVQDGVAWFGEALNFEVQVEPPPPPPPPDSGELVFSLTLQDGGTLLYEAISPDPSVTPSYPQPRHAKIVSVSNPSSHVFHLAHKDAAGHQTPYYLVKGTEIAAAPFAGLEVEGLWRAIYRGPDSTPPASLTLGVAWSTV